MPVIDDDFLSRLVYEPLFVETPESQQKAFEKVQRLVGVRERCTSELRERLAKDGFSGEDAQAAVDRAVRCGLVDDRRYAAMLIRTRISQGKGRKGIEQELSDVGISVWDVDGWPEAFFPEEGVDAEVQRALEVLQRKPVRAKNQREGAFRRLVSKGYSASVASVAARLYADGDRGELW